MCSVDPLHNILGEQLLQGSGRPLFLRGDLEEGGEETNCSLHCYGQSHGPNWYSSSLSSSVCSKVPHSADLSGLHGSGSQTLIPEEFELLVTLPMYSLHYCIITFVTIRQERTKRHPVDHQSSMHIPPCSHHGTQPCLLLLISVNYP